MGIFNNSARWVKTGERYCGREVVRFRWGKAFGRGDEEGRATVVNGWLNPLEMRKSGGKNYPTPYWAVMDGICYYAEKAFTKLDVIHYAMDTLREWEYKLRPLKSGVREGRASKDVRLYKACEIAWYVIKTHHKHPMKRGLGWGFMVEKGEGGGYWLRERRVDEVFAGKRAKKAIPAVKAKVPHSPEKDVPLKTVILRSL